MSLRRHVRPSTVEELPQVYLAEWSQRSVAPDAIDNAEYWARNASKWDVAGSWRAKYINGTLWLRFLTAQPHWAERTNVLRLLLLALGPTLSPRNAWRSPSSRADGTFRRALPAALPDFDIVYVHNDRDPTPWRGWPCNKPHGQICANTQIPLFTNAHEARRSSRVSFRAAACAVSLPAWSGWAQLVGEAPAVSAPAVSNAQLHARPDSRFASTPQVIDPAPRILMGGLAYSHATLVRSLAQPFRCIERDRLDGSHPARFLFGRSDPGPVPARSEAACRAGCSARHSERPARA